MKKQPTPQRGRPPMQPDERKGNLIAFRVEPDTRNAFDKAAKKSGKKLSDWIRDTLLDAISPSPKAG